ncbi:uncharacterized protein G2W53_010432 [Senna tora]|uniref:Uncharacterized protein n=1 Tax=Senna tora TaxID=362788 RepID=A0A834X108_9FABA|nr:uncharacterized protein G2W53_010432 [Senna tora]
MESESVLCTEELSENLNFEFNTRNSRPPKVSQREAIYRWRSELLEPPICGGDRDRN